MNGLLNVFMFIAVGLLVGGVVVTEDVEQEDITAE